MKDQPTEPAADLYRLTQEQVDFVSSLIQERMEIRGNAIQARKILALVDGIEAALKAPVPAKE